jgi:hypothetical protein
MERGDISNIAAITIAIDFEALILPPKTKWKSFVFKALNKFPLRIWNFDSRCFTLAMYSLDRSAEIFAYYLLENEINISVLVRMPPMLGMKKAVGKVLGEDDWAGFPVSEYLHTDLSKDMTEQAKQVDVLCKQHSIARLYTKDIELAKRLPRSLVKLIDDWEKATL